MRDNFQRLFRKYLKHILIEWLEMNDISQKWYQEHVYSTNNEVDQLIRDNLSDAVSRYEKYFLSNPFLDVKEYFSTNYDISKFNNRWNEQINGKVTYMSLMDIAKKANKKITNRFKVTYYDKDTKLIKEEVLSTGSDDYNRIMPLAMDKDFDNITGEWVSNDTPVGLVGNAKVLSVRNGERSYMHVTIHYELKNGIPRFRNFKPVETLRYKIIKHSKSDGDILALELKTNSIEPVDRIDVKNLRHLLSVIQVFNNDILAEATDDGENVEQKEENHDSQKVEKSTSSFRKNQ